MEFCLEDYPDKWCLMYCKNISEHKSFLEFLNDNGKKWRTGNNYLSEMCPEIGAYYAFNRGFRLCNPASALSNYSILHWSDFNNDGENLYTDEYKNVEDAISYLIGN